MRDECLDGTGMWAVGWMPICRDGDAGWVD